MATQSTNEKLSGLYDQLQFGKHMAPGRKTKGPLTGNKANNLRKTLSAIAKRRPEVMVKISGGGKGMTHVKNHINYISRRGEIEIEDQDGNKLSGKDDIKQLLKEWQTSGSYIPDESTRKEAFNLVLSMPKGTPPEGVLSAVRDFAKKEFVNNDYVMALHTYETDPDPNPSPNPHVHLAVKARGYDGKRLNPRKTDLRRWREEFAEQLRSNGIDAAATSRSQRFKRDKGLKQSIHHMLERGEKPKTQGSTATKAQIEKAKLTELEVSQSYREIIKTLAASDEQDKKLAGELSRTLFGAGLVKVLEQGRVEQRGEGREAR